ncbi:MAG: 4-(cytidine 5'-diphospho)-2-C-methyl-D-erythritol kinase [Nitrospirales bacterium]|nr:4-(cytidine 5'-diphospho)-2-C-methyl-D-erythritol kinase [Nitrospira sp.]MDR4500446.1 4-(cytidine 5'-diphospho)-2-C-methyl-D-erythritol kinase [Nitrospirales bacterium]
MTASALDEVRVSAPAKLNLILKILGRLPNGYHELWSIMHTVDFFDYLTIQRNPSSTSIRLTCQLDSLSVGEDNLVYRAAARVLEKAHLVIGVDIHLEKHIPMGAGLGGGSSDAAATILGLVQLLGLGWSRQEMANVGGEIGSDVPFFFYAPQACIRGWGEIVEPVTMTGNRWVLLVNPGFPIETGWAYQRVAESRTRVPSLPPELQQVQQEQTLDFGELMPLMKNDFETALFPAIPRLAEIKQQLYDLGADVALLSGSGSTLFGLFADQAGALRAGKTLEENPQITVYCVKTSSVGLAIM